jgi:hypothetical protein
MKADELLKIARIEAALRVRGPRVELRNVECLGCGTNIPRYIGPEAGVLCSTCSEVNYESGCTRIKPLAITRGTLNE